MTPLLSVRGLSLDLAVEGAMRTVLRDVSFEIETGAVLGLVGESGSGKTMTARAAVRLLPPGAHATGEIVFDGDDVLKMSPSGLRSYRSTDVAMIFQDPRAYINPVRRIDDFLTEGLIRLRGVRRAEAIRRATQALADVSIDDPERRMRQYPHQLSGGMLQRVMIASTVLMEPRLILADEPTTALDVTTQAEVLSILDRLRREMGMAMVFITHDLELAVGVCDEVGVMYAGEIVERCAAGRLELDSRHPYTAALIASRPSITARAERMAQVSGHPLSAFEAPSGCAFQTRCAFVQDRCRAEHPALEPSDGGLVRCLRADELHAAGARP